MPKPKPNLTTKPATATSEIKLDKQQQRLALRLIRAVTGCGDLAAKQRLESLTPEQAKRIADLEAANNRREAIPILY